MLLLMKTCLTTLAISGILACICFAQDSAPSGPLKTAISGDAKALPPNTDDTVYYTSLNRRVFEFSAQAQLLSQLSQEHRKRAEETLADQTSKAQWENELVKDLDDKALIIVGVVNNLRKERRAFEQAHPDLIACLPPNPLVAGSNARSPDEIVFLSKLEERLAAVQQEIAETIEGGTVYAAPRP